MNFDFSEEERELQGTVARMLTECCPSAEVRRVLEGEAPFATTAWNHLIETGAATAAIPHEYRGSGLGVLVLCLVAEEVGRHLAPVPLASSCYLAAQALLLGGSEAQKRRWLPAIATGQLIATAALGASERYLREPALTFDGQTLDGAVAALPDGAVAGLAILRVGDDLVLADLSATGVRRRAVASIDPTRPFAEVMFDAVPAARLAGGAAADRVVARVLDGAAVLLAFEQVGGATRILERSRDYALERKAFGRQIGGFQALKHRMADIYTRNELARVHAYYGAWALARDAAELPTAAAAARVAATTAFNFATEEGIEIHGGIGYTWQMDCHLYLRRARHLAQLIGTEHHWRSRLAELLVRNAA